LRLVILSEIAPLTSDAVEAPLRFPSSPLANFFALLRPRKLGQRIEMRVAGELAPVSYMKSVVRPDAEGREDQTFAEKDLLTLSPVVPRFENRRSVRQPRV